MTKSNTVPFNSAVQDSVSHKVQTEGQKNCSLLEKKIRVETEARVAVEKQLAEVSAQKLMKQRFYFGAHHTGNCIDKVIVQEPDVYINLVNAI